MRRNHLLTPPPACVTMYSLTLVFSRDVAPLPRHVMPHTDGAVIVKSIWSRRRDIVPFISAPAKILSPWAVSQESPRNFSPSQSIYPMLTMSINANTVLTLCNVGALCNNSLLHVPAQGKLRKNCESCPHKLPGKSSFNVGSVCPVCPLCLL